MKLFILLFIFLVIWFICNIPSTRDQTKVHNAKALVLLCIDFRLIDDVGNLMDRLGYKNNYDEFILAGASLGYNQDMYDYWKKTLEDHINISSKLHHIKEIVVVDHMDCGFYKQFYHRAFIPEDEQIKLHIENLEKFKETLKVKYPDKEIKTMLMDLNGNIVDLKSPKLN